MSRTQFERLKFFFLIFLVMTSLIQVGILWNVQSHGLPTNFLSLFLSPPGERQPADISEYVKPFRIIVTEGFDTPHWVIEKQHKDYAHLWEEARLFLSDIMKGDVTGSKSDYTDERWGSLVVKKSVVFEFKTRVGNNLISAALNTQTSKNVDVTGIYKMIILPEEDIINNNMVVYIWDDEKIYKFSSLKPHHLQREDYNNLIRNFGKDMGMKSFGVITEIMSGKNNAIRIKPDILYLLGSDSTWGFGAASCSIPDSLQNPAYSKVLQSEKIGEQILGKEKDDYLLGIGTNDSIVFKNLSSIYRIYSDGFLEYKYLSDIEDSGVKDESIALNKSIRFMDTIRTLIPGEKLLLTGIKENSGSFTFTFDYEIDGRPVHFDQLQTSSMENKYINHAVTISANNKGVTACSFMLRTFSLQKGVTTLYNANFLDVLDSVFQKYDKDFSIDDVDISYQMRSEQRTGTLSPVWVIKSMNGNSYIATMQEEKGD